jgi:acyl-coenzyme A synthetase/AMP-(fatty) acid ligase
MGLQKGDRVVFYMKNIPQFVIAQYAIWKAGHILLTYLQTSDKRVGFLVNIKVPWLVV